MDIFSLYSLQDSTQDEKIENLYKIIDVLLKELGYKLDEVEVPTGKTGFFDNETEIQFKLKKLK